MWPFRKKRELGAARKAGEPGLSAASREYRHDRIGEIARMTEKSWEAAAELGDRWIVDSVMSTVGDGEPTLQFVPHPLWDDEWMMSREYFDDREEAFAHVESKGGELLVPRGD